MEWEEFEIHGKKYAHSYFQAQGNLQSLQAIAMRLKNRFFPNVAIGNVSIMFAPMGSPQKEKLLTNGSGDSYAGIYDWRRGVILLNPESLMLDYPADVQAIGSTILHELAHAAQVRCSDCLPGRDDPHGAAFLHYANLANEKAGLPPISGDEGKLWPNFDLKPEWVEGDFWLPEQYQELSELAKTEEERERFEQKIANWR